jgi:hypothetical protein
MISGCTPLSSFKLLCMIQSLSLSSGTHLGTHAGHRKIPSSRPHLYGLAFQTFGSSVGVTVDELS